MAQKVLHYIFHQQPQTWPAFLLRNRTLGRERASRGLKRSPARLHGWQLMARRRLRMTAYGPVIDITYERVES